MAWAKNYWDTFHHLFWAPEFLGLDPIKKEILKTLDPAFLNGSSIRYRSRKWEETFFKLKGDEKTLNGFFDIMFSICPDSIIDDWLCRPLGISDLSQFKSYSLLEIYERYGWGTRNVMQPDGLFTSTDSIISVEIKLNAQTSIDQILKYAALITTEERISGRRKNLGLLYIVPESRLTEISRKFIAWGRPLDWKALQSHPSAPALNRYVMEIIEADETNFAGVVARLRLEVISWSYLYNKASEAQKELNPANSKEQTLYRLLEGFLEQLSEHRATGIKGH
jgi:hypothetical protein